MKRISADGILQVADFCENVLIDKNQKAARTIAVTAGIIL